MSVMTEQQKKRLEGQDAFVSRHIGLNEEEIQAMLSALGISSLPELLGKIVPDSIARSEPLDIDGPMSERDVIEDLRTVAQKNQVFRSYLGMGFSDCITPPVIQRNILENPGWYTQYTPYQSEIAQGRLEALLNFQTLIGDLTGLPVSNSSLLDEATAAAEAMSMCLGIKARQGATTFFVSNRCHPATIEVIRTRALPLGIVVLVEDEKSFDYAGTDGLFAALLQYPATDGCIEDYREVAAKVHDAGAMVVVAADLLSLVLLTPPAEFGADVCVGNSQRFGVPLGYGGPHAGFFSTREEYKRQIPGRIVGVSKDVKGRRALRLALQTREQHIRREKATSNICTAQVLLAIMASMYAVYHGPKGLLRIANRLHRLAVALGVGLSKLGYSLSSNVFFDTVHVKVDPAVQEQILAGCRKLKINLRSYEEGSLVIALDETTSIRDLEDVLSCFATNNPMLFSVSDLVNEVETGLPEPHARKGEILTHPVFRTYHSETEFLRYVHRLQAKDLSLTTSMIPLGSCTMKLNATSEMIPVTWPEFGRMHPFCPVDQAQGYRELFSRLEGMLAEITGFAAVSLQPNAGSQGEYAGLLVIRRHLEELGQGERNICLIPQSAHGTNPASAVMAGFKVVVVKCDDQGNIDVADLRSKATKHQDFLAASMITYPSTHGVFEGSIREVCQIIHEHGGQVYLDGANLNAQVGVCRPGDYGADVCHLNLHKTFCIPHGGGGPGMGPIGVAAHLAPYLPGHPLVSTGGEKALGPISAAPWGSASILPISYVFIALLGSPGLTKSTQVAILNANYMAHRLREHYPLLYTGESGFVAHEFILDFRHLKKTSGVEVEDVAKRLMDYGFHAPTVSFPVPGTLMIEPTESECRAELDRFCDALISIRGEIQEIEDGTMDREDNLLKNAPHTCLEATSDEWSHGYPRERAVFPTNSTREHKFWPPVARINNVFGDRNLVCSCPPIEDYE